MVTMFHTVNLRQIHILSACFGSLQTHKATNFYHGPLVELTEAMTSMGLSGGQTALSISTYQHVAHCLQDLAPCEPEEVSSYPAASGCRLVVCAH